MITIDYILSFKDHSELQNLDESIEKKFKKLFNNKYKNKKYKHKTNILKNPKIQKLKVK